MNKKKESKVVPNVRFKGFTDDWKQRKLGEVATFINGRAYSQDELQNSGKYKVLRVGNFYTNDSWYFSDMELDEKYYAKDGDLLYTWSATFGPHIWHGDKVIYHYHIWKVELSNILEKSFAVQLLEQDKDKILSDKNGSTMVHITKSGMEQKKALLPPSIKEQANIGEYFSNLDHLITLHQQKITLLIKLKKAMLEKMFPKKGSVIPEIRFNGFANAWEQRKLSDVVDVCSGRDYKHLSEGDIPVYGTGGYMLSVSEALSYDKDAIGIGRKGTIDKPYILNAPFWTVDTLFYAIPREKIDLNFAFDIFQNIDWKKKDESTGVPSLSKTAINEINVLVPQYDEQQALGEFFNGIDHLITLHQRKIDKIKNMKKAMLDQMFIQ
ncbi:MAG: restriction endonuclease subunit S [Ligilactobacillus ruminis]